MNAALVTFLIYMVGVFLLAAAASRLLAEKDFLSEYFLGSRGLGMWAFALTFAATSASGGTFTGFPALIYTNGWIMALWIASYMVVPICTMGLMGKRINQVARKSNAITVPDILRDRYDSALFGLVGTLLIIFFLAFNLVAQFKAGSVILETLLSGVDIYESSGTWLGSALPDWRVLQTADGSLVEGHYLLCLLTFGLTVVIYTTYGGFHAVVWTDVMQGIVMVAGVMIMLPLALYEVNGLENATRTMATIGEPGTLVTGPGPTTTGSEGFLPLGVAISFFFMWALSGSGQPQYMVRLMAFKDTKTLRRSIITVTIYYTLIYLPLVVIFCCARILIPDMEGKADSIMPQMAVYLTENVGMGWLAGLLVAAPFAAVMSTVDSFLLVISSAVVRDVYQRNINADATEKQIKRISYCATLVVGVIAILGAVNPPEFLQDIIVYVGSGLAACFLFPVLAMLYWPRSNMYGCLAGMLGGFAAHLGMHIIGWFVNGAFVRPYLLGGFSPVVVGLAASFLCVALVTPATPRPPDHLVRKYFYQEA